MKGYEVIAKGQLIKRMPVAIRIDGKAFHTFTKGMQKPFDKNLVRAMQETTLKLCQNIQGCVFGYTQSDEITLILIDYQTFETSAWFDNEIQKICSIAASMATLYFNKEFAQRIKWFAYNPEKMNWDEYVKYCEVYEKAVEKGAMFDARCFNIPKEEVANLIYWRQLDAMRNSVQMVGQYWFSHKELQGKNCNNIKEMLVQRNLTPWEEYPVYFQRGSACFKNKLAGIWGIDIDMPIIKDDRDYVNKQILYKDE